MLALGHGQCLLSPLLSRRRHVKTVLGRWVLFILFALTWFAFITVVPDLSGWASAAGGVGVAAFGLLVVWWSIVGFSGYERLAGVRIIRHEGNGRAAPHWAWWAVPAAVAVLGMAWLESGERSVAVVAIVAISVGMVLVGGTTRLFSVFASVSVVGVAIGVAALIVVQSVATGFQHEFERRVLGVYAHINVTRPPGIAEYRRFERYLRTLPGVVGVSPFAYHGMILAPYEPDGVQAGDLRQAGVTVKGIEPETAHEVIDLQQHLDRAGNPPAKIGDLRSDLVLRPVLDREDEELPPDIAAVSDPRGEHAYADAMETWRQAASARRAGDVSREGDWGDDEWPEPRAGQLQEFDPATLPTVFIGSTLAARLGVGVGELVVMVDPGSSFDHGEPPRVAHYRIAGLFRAGFQEYDAQLAYLHIKELQRFKYQGRDVVSGLDLRLADPYRAPEIERQLEAQLGPEYTILEWQKLNANLFSSIRQQKSMLTVILSLVSAVAGFNVLAALWTMVVRRSAEIAILMGMGATEPSVARVFQFAGMTIGASGCVAGLGYGLLLCRLVELYGYTLDPEVYFIDRLPVEYDPSQMGVVLSLTLLVCFVATIPPALRAAKLRPVDGLRYD